MIADGNSSNRPPAAASPPSPASDGTADARDPAAAEQSPSPNTAALNKHSVTPGTPKSADPGSPCAKHRNNSTPPPQQPPLSLAPPSSSRLSSTNPISPALSLRHSPDLRGECMLGDNGVESLDAAQGGGAEKWTDLTSAFARSIGLPKEQAAQKPVRCQSKTLSTKRKRRSVSGLSGGGAAGETTPPPCENNLQSVVSLGVTDHSASNKKALSSNRPTTAANTAASSIKGCTAAGAVTAAVAPKSSSSGSKKKAARSLGDHRDHPKAALEPCISGLDLCKEAPPFYCSLGDDDSAPSPTVAEYKTVNLEYPGVNASETFPLLTPNKALEYNPTKDLYVTTAMIWEHCVPPNRRDVLGDVKTGILRGIQRAVHRKSPADLCEAVEAWNKQMILLKTQQKAFNQAEFTGPPASYQMVAHILEQAYSRSVAPSSSLLNQYEGFSNNVYGEVKHNFVNTIIKEARIQPHHIFLDMGSGIANVVLQVAAQCLCYSYGIEVMDIPAKLAVQQRKEFISRMRYYAKPCGRIKLKHADFLEDPSFPEVIKSADVIFVNNYAFSAELNQRILGLFLDLKEGATVISLRSFLPVDRPTSRSTRRNNAIESIFTVKEHFFGRDCVSWMNEGGHYYIHKVDRKQLARRVR
ncbi:Nucleosomal histone H3-Lys79 methylase [Geranomyces michiganensis]|nr:Nucleosomal histone H3-Lys79 methylase [Geranomyces michiganensis]